MTDPYTKQPVRIPVKRVDGRWEFFYGGEVPVNDGTVGDLIVDRASIRDVEFLKLLGRRSDHKILEAKTRLLVALTIKPTPAVVESLTQHLISPQNLKLDASYYASQRPANTRFVTVTIGGPTELQLKRDPKATGGVWLRLDGVQPKGLTTSTVVVPPEVSGDPLNSLNHAFTRLSEAYEPWRISHTGNIYTRILYQERNDRWCPLEVLRNAAEAKAEHKLIQEQWQRISEQLQIQAAGAARPNED